MPKAQKQKFNNQSGFTLIELLVVISIIGLLSSIILVNVAKTRIKARDAKRQADLSQLQKALELYYSDNNHYPISQCSGAGASTIDDWVCADCPNTSYNNLGTCDVVDGPVTSANINATLSKYVKNIKDPRHFNNDDSGYWYKSLTGADYKFSNWLNPEDRRNYSAQFIDPTCCLLPVLPDGSCSGPGTSGDICMSMGVWTPGAVTY